MGGGDGDARMNLVIFGLGYSARHFIEARADRHVATTTVTTREKARALTRPGLDVRVFSPDERDSEIDTAIADADAALVSIGPDENGDPALRAFGEAIARAPRLGTVVYLSTIGVYGDHAGAWIDETTPCAPTNERSRQRLRVENEWLALGARAGKAVHILRLAGIYGPGQNALVNLRNGTARRIVKSGQVFNRIHVADIGAAIDACLTYKGAGRVWNVCDDEPAPAEDVVTYAASLLGVEPPPPIDFATANLSPMARSFYSECKRASNRAMKQDLGVALAYPTYREAMRALLAAGDGR
jgi:nucleoside-diphosphate-sugar epimerase